MAVEIHEDMPLVEPAAAPTRQIWVPMVHRFANYPGVQMPPEIGNGQDATGTFAVPHDFVSWSRIRLVVFANADANFNLSIRVDGATCGELYVTHTQTLAQAFALTDSRFNCLDLSALMAAVFGALSPDDYVQVRVTNNTVGALTVYGFDLRY